MIGKFSINAARKNPQTVREIYERGYQLARTGYDPRTTLSPALSARFIHHKNLRIADLAHYSFKALRTYTEPKTSRIKQLQIDKQHYWTRCPRQPEPLYPEY